MKLLLTLILLCSFNVQSQLNVQTNMMIDRVDIKHMEELQYSHVNADNIEGSRIVLYLEEYQAYSIIFIDVNGWEYYATLKFKEDKVEMICSCNYTYKDSQLVITL